MDSVLALRVRIVVCGVGATAGSGPRAQAAVTGLCLRAFGAVIGVDRFGRCWIFIGMRLVAAAIL